MTFLLRPVCWLRGHGYTLKRAGRTVCSRCGQRLRTYREAVLDADPLAYWPLDGSDPPTSLTESSE